MPHPRPRRLRLRLRLRSNEPAGRAMVRRGWPHPGSADRVPADQVFGHWPPWPLVEVMAGGWRRDGQLPSPDVTPRSKPASTGEPQELGGPPQRSSPSTPPHPPQSVAPTTSPKDWLNNVLAAAPRGHRGGLVSEVQYRGAPRTRVSRRPTTRACLHPLTLRKVRARSVESARSRPSTLNTEIRRGRGRRCASAAHDRGVAGPSVIPVQRRGWRPCRRLAGAVAARVVRTGRSARRRSTAWPRRAATLPGVASLT